jgi:Ca-activated chloride channel family protein
MTCKEYRELIALSVENDLSSPELEWLETHLQTCSACRDFEADMLKSQAELKDVAGEVPNEDTHLARVRQNVLNNIAERKVSRSHSWFAPFRWTPVLVAALMAIVATAGVIIISRSVSQPVPKSSSGAPSKKIVPQISHAPQTQPQTQSKPSQQVELTVEDVESEIYGTVTDDHGVKLPGVSVTLTSRSSKSRSATSDSNGEFRFDHVKKGNYSVQFAIEGFGDLRQEGISIQLHKPVELMAKLKPSTVEEVTVTGESPLIDTKSTASSTLARDYLEDVPSARDPFVVGDSQSLLDSDRYSADGSTTEMPAAQPSPTPAYAASPPPAPPAPAFAQPPVAEPEVAEQYTRSDHAALEEQLQIADEVIVLQQQQENLAKANANTTQGTLRAQNTNGELVGDFPLRHTEVKAEISGYLARTDVTQEYTNPFREPIEAIYVFPLPSMAAIHDFVMEVAGRKIVGVVRPREEAERIYREARERGQTASLLTQERPNIFTQNVANIEPGGKVKIHITYFERLKYEKDNYEYLFPMTVGPRYIPGNPVPSKSTDETPGASAPTTSVPDANRISPPVLKPGHRSGHDIGMTIHLDAGLPIMNIKSLAHEVKIKDDGLNRRTIKLKEEDSILNRDFVLKWSVAGKETQFGVLAHKGEKGGFFTLMMQPPLEPSDAQVTPREITFILDVSGSMNGIPIEMSKNIVNQTLDRLRPDDIFNIFIFAGDNAQLWQTPQPNTPQNVVAGKNFINSLQGGGGTEMLAGVERALKAQHDPKYLQMFVFLTDGFVGNENEILKVVKEERGEARFFAFGIGSSVNRFLIDGIGKLGGGISHIVLSPDEEQGKAAVDRFFECIDSPVLVDVAIDWNGLPIRNVYPKKIDDLFAGQTITVIGRYFGAARGTVFVTGRVGARDVRYPVQFELPSNEERNSALAPVWARNRIEELSEQLLTADATTQSEFVQKITEVALSYNLVSQYTSFVAVDESRIVSNGRPLKVLQPVEIPKNVNYETAYGERISGQPVRVSSWGMIVAINQAYKVQVIAVDPGSVAATSGVKAGNVIESLNGVLVHDLKHLEALLLQATTKVEIRTDSGNTILLPAP